MNWEDIENNEKTKNLLIHAKKLGQFRANHPAIGAGTHQIITKQPYLFYRSYYKDDYKDIVVVGLELPIGLKTLDVSKLFKDGDLLHDAYSNQDVEVINGKVTLNSEYSIALLELK